MTTLVTLDASRAGAALRGLARLAERSAWSLEDLLAPLQVEATQDEFTLADA
jgi:hypothetical protein